MQDLPAGFQWFGLGQDAGRWLVVAVRRWRSSALVAWCLREPGGRPGGLRHRLRRRGRAAGRASGRRAVVFGVVRRRWARSTGLAALLTAVRFATSSPTPGVGLELQVIAAVVVGGTRSPAGAARSTGTLDRRRAARHDRPGADLPRRPGAVGAAIQGAHHPGGRRLRRALGERGRRRGHRRRPLGARTAAPHRGARIAPTREAVLLALLVVEMVVLRRDRHQLLHASTTRFEIAAAERRGRPARRWR